MGVGPLHGWPQKWEFPGGKIEFGEIPQAWIERELYEELGI
jgi:8-oxo-dGTP diphosphatase